MKRKKILKTQRSKETKSWLFERINKNRETLAREESISEMKKHYNGHYRNTKDH
jgi:hypothetical protein